MKFLLVGNVSAPEGNPDGQRIKTLQIFEAMQIFGQASVDVLDTSHQRFSLLFRTWRHLKDVDHVFLLPGKRLLLAAGLFLRGYKFFARRSRVASHLVVVGGWLPVVGRNQFYKWSLAAFDSISPETPEIAKDLHTPSRPVYCLPNFRIHPDKEIRRPPSKSCGLNLLFVSRITRSKGIFDAIHVADIMRQKSIPVTLRIFGPLNFENQADEALFSQKLRGRTNYVKYLGILKPDSVISTLTSHDCLLFPSTYAGEGFPGIIVESLLAGTPVIARKHLYLSALNQLYDFGFVTAHDYVNEAASILEHRQHVVWKKNWEIRRRFSGLNESFGYPAFEAWIAEIISSRRP